MLKRLVVCWAFSVCAAAAASAQVYATLVLVHGHVWTENSAQPEEEAVAVYGNRILRVANRRMSCGWQAHPLA